MSLANDSPSFTLVYPQIRVIGPQDLHLWKGRGQFGNQQLKDQTRMVRIFHN